LRKVARPLLQGHQARPDEHDHPRGQRDGQPGGHESWPRSRAQALQAPKDPPRTHSLRRTGALAQGNGRSHFPVAPVHISGFHAQALRQGLAAVFRERALQGQRPGQVAGWRSWRGRLQPGPVGRRWRGHAGRKEERGSGWGPERLVVRRGHGLGGRSCRCRSASDSTTFWRRL